MPFRDGEFPVGARRAFLQMTSFIMFHSMTFSRYSSDELCSLRFLYQSRAEVTHDGHSAEEKQTNIILALRAFPPSTLIRIFPFTRLFHALVVVVPIRHCISMFLPSRAGH